MEGTTKLTQCEKIIRHLREYGSISSLEAITEYGILRLASRVSDLKRRGYNIVGETKTGKNRFGESTSFKVYRLIEKEGNLKMTLKERIEYAEKRYEENREAKVSEDFWMGYVAGLKAHLADLEEESEKEGN